MQGPGKSLEMGDIIEQVGERGPGYFLIKNGIPEKDVRALEYQVQFQKLEDFVNDEVRYFSNHLLTLGEDLSPADLRTAIESYRDSELPKIMAKEESSDEEKLARSQALKAVTNYALKAMS